MKLNRLIISLLMDFWFPSDIINLNSPVVQYKKKRWNCIAIWHFSILLFRY
jgi:hypothetical protein